MRKELQNYLDYTKMPWSILFYEIIWDQMGHVRGKKIIDFGSGLGITADFLAENNQVIAIEPDADMIDLRQDTHVYTKLLGSLKHLETIEDESIDMIICHNVFEYVEDKTVILKAFERILKTDGRLSIVKHNHLGRVMQKVVFENNVDEAMGILLGDEGESASFGKINYYDNEELIADNDRLVIENYYGVRTFFALQQNNEEKHKPSWKEKMFLMEKQVSDIPQFKDISFYHHVLLRKK